MSITLGNHSFEGPYTNTTSLNRRSGVYAILGRSGQAANWSVVDIGEAGDVRERVETHDRKDCWRGQRHATTATAAHYCDANARARIEGELRKQYNPPCGER